MFRPPFPRARLSARLSCVQMWPENAEPLGVSQAHILISLIKIRQPVTDNRSYRSDGKPDLYRFYIQLNNKTATLAKFNPKEEGIDEGRLLGNILENLLEALNVNNIQGRQTHETPVSVAGTICPWTAENMADVEGIRQASQDCESASSGNRQDRKEIYDKKPTDISGVGGIWLRKQPVLVTNWGLLKKHYKTISLEVVYKLVNQVNHGRQHSPSPMDHPLTGYKRLRFAFHSIYTSYIYIYIYLTRHARYKRRNEANLQTL